jgi:hypothetical protein
MAQLNVGTDTTPLELADFFRRLHADDTVSGKRGSHGELVLYANVRGSARKLLSSLEECTVTRVAVEVVLHPLSNVVGAELALRHVQSALARPRPVRVGDVRGPLGVLAGLYGKVLTAAGKTEGEKAQVHFVRASAEGGAQAAEQELSEAQRKMLKSLIDKLIALSDPPSSR